MSKKFFIVFIMVFILIFMILTFGKNHEENVQIKNESESSSNESVSSKEYDVVLSDDAITFNSDDGTSIIYTFEGDHLANVLLVVTTESEEAAQFLKSEYEKQVGDGIIDRVVSSDNIVSIRYNQKYFEEYQNLTRAEIEELLLHNSDTNIIYNEGEKKDE